MEMSKKSIYFVLSAELFLGLCFLSVIVAGIVAVTSDRLTWRSQPELKAAELSEPVSATTPVEKQEEELVRQIISEG